MGSGDLNMKKSWHPLLHTNQERVWKQEKKALEERKKLAELRKEQEQERAVLELQKLQAESGGKKFEQKVEWMYAAPAEGNGPNAEELEQYLLGKKRVDKLLRGNEEKLMAAPTGAAVGGSFTSIQNANSVRDTAAKIREDPLLAIKRQEQAQYEKILKNPKRLKELRAAREAGMTPAHGSSIKEKKSKKDETKEERRARKDAKNGHGHGHSRGEGREKERERDEQYDVGHKRRREDDEISDRHSRRPKSRSASPPLRRPHHDDRERDRDDRRPRYDDRERDSDRRSYRDSDRAPPPSHHQRSRSRSPPPPRHERPTSPDTKPTLPRSYSNDAPSSTYRRPAPPQPRATAPPTADELAARSAAVAARLEAMQSSASAIQSERNARLTKLEAEDKAQLEKEAASRERERKGGVGPSFLREQEKKVFAGGMDLGERIKRSGKIGLVGDRE